MTHRSVSGFTMMEILVAMVLLAVVGATALSSFTSTTMMTQSDDSTAYNVARGYLEQLHEYVRQDTWSDPNAPLALNGATLPTLPANPQTLDGVTYTAAYAVNPANPGVAVDVNGDGQEDYRRVRLTVSY